MTGRAETAPLLLSETPMRSGCPHILICDELMIRTGGCIADDREDDDDEQYQWPKE